MFFKCKIMYFSHCLFSKQLQICKWLFWKLLVFCKLTYVSFSGWVLCKQGVCAALCCMAQIQLQAAHCLVKDVIWYSSCEEIVTICEVLGLAGEVINPVHLCCPCDLEMNKRLLSVSEKQWKLSFITIYNEYSLKDVVRATVKMQMVRVRRVCTHGKARGFCCGFDCTVCHPWGGSYQKTGHCL